MCACDRGYTCTRCRERDETKRRLDELADADERLKEAAAAAVEPEHRVGELQ